MTLPSANHRNNYVGNGATSVYSYTFKIFASSDLEVTQQDLAGAVTTLILSTHYTVSGVGAAAGGSITLTAGNLTTNFKLTIRRVRLLTQTTDLRNQGNFYPETYEDAYDHLMMVCQQLKDDIDLSPRLPATTTGINMTLPAPEALKWYRLNAGGTAWELMSAGSLTGVTAFTADLVLSGSTLSLDKPVLRGLAGGTGNALTMTASPAPTVLSDGLRVQVRATANNTTGATFDLNGLGVKAIRRKTNLTGGLNISEDDISGASHYLDLVYDGTNGVWMLMNPARELRCTTTERDNHFTGTTPDGLLIYNTSDVAHQVYATTGWLNISLTTATETLSNKTLTTPTIASLANANHNHLNAAGGGALSGAVVQVVYASDFAWATMTATTPYDNTIPQNTEGTEVMTATITPKSATSKLYVEACVELTGDTAGSRMAIVALFRDSTADALKTAWHIISTANENVELYLQAAVVATSATATTFKIRGGDNVGTAFFNGNNIESKFGGTQASYMRITEVLA